jgi:hypothetical protein
VRSVSCIPRDSSCHRGSSSRQSRRSRRTAQQNLTAQRGRSPFGHRCPAAPGASDSSSRKAMRGSAGRSRQGRTASHRAQLQHGPDLTCCHFSLLSTASKSSRSFRAGSEGLGSASATSATSSASAIRLIRLAGLAVNRGLNSGSIFIHSPQEMLGVDRENTRGNLQSRSKRFSGAGVRRFCARCVQSATLHTHASSGTWTLSPCISSRDSICAHTHEGSELAGRRTGRAGAISGRSIARFQANSDGLDITDANWQAVNIISGYACLATQRIDPAATK